MDGKETYCNCEKYVQSAKGVIVMLFFLVIGLYVCVILISLHFVYSSNDLNNLITFVIVLSLVLMIFTGLYYGGFFNGLIE